MERQEYIGSSDAWNICHKLFGKFYADKMKVIEEDLSDNFKVQFGSYVEPFHLDWLTNHVEPTWEWSKGADSERQHFATIEYATALKNKMVLGSHPDALIRLPDESWYPVEVKHTGRFKDLNEAIHNYMPQLQHHMMCWKKDRIYFSIIIGNDEPVGAWVGESMAYQKWYIELCERAWDFVAEKHPPAMTGNSVATDAMEAAEKAATVPINGMKVRYLSDTNNVALDLLAGYNASKKTLADADMHHEEWKKDLKALLLEDEKEVTLKGKFSIKRNAKGSVIPYIKDKEHGLD